MIRSGEVQYHPSLEHLLIDIDSIAPHPENYNNGDIDEIKDSILTNGMGDPVGYQLSSRHILDGNHTWLACKELHATVIPGYALDVDNTTALRMLIAFNSVARHARPDRTQLLALVAKIAEDRSPVGLIGTGLTERDVEAMTAMETIPLSYAPEAWPSVVLQMSPKLWKAFRHLTREADNDTDRIELLMRMAGWDG